jgi:hypothetical protein
LSRPKRGTPERRAWLSECVRLTASTLRHDGHTLKIAAFHAFGKANPGRAWPCNDDIRDVGGWRAARDLAFGVAPLVVPSVAAYTEQRAPEAPPRAPDALEDHRLAREVARLKSENAALLLRLDDATRIADHVQAVRADGTPVGVQRRERVFGLREATALALASDWHVEELVDPRTVNNLNAYDLSIAERSARRFFEGILWLIESHRSSFAIRDLILWLGGDLITGYIHEELVESNQLSPLGASRFARQLIAQGIRMLLAESDLEQIIVPCSYGNHGRTTPKSRISTGAANSYEHTLYHFLADDFANEPRVRFAIAGGELLYLPVYDMRVRFTHGDAIQYGGGVGGITIPVNKAISQWDKSIRADLTCMGHWHQFQSVSRTIVNGSLIGHGPYSVRIKAEYEVPRQAFALIDSRRGVCQSTPIWVREDDHERELDPAASDAIRRRLSDRAAA